MAITVTRHYIVTTKGNGLALNILLQDYALGYTCHVMNLSKPKAL